MKVQPAPTLRKPTTVQPAAAITVGAGAPALKRSRVWIRDDPDEGLRIHIFGRPFLDEFDLLPFVVGLLVLFGIAGTVLVEGLRGKIPDFHPFHPFMVWPGLCGLALLAGNVLLMLVDEMLVLDGEVLVLAYSLFGLRGAKRLNLRHVGPLSYNPVSRRVTVPSTDRPWDKAEFGLRLSPDEADSIVSAVAAYRLRPPRRPPAPGQIRRVDPMRGLGRSSWRVRATHEAGTFRVRLESPVSGTSALMFLLGLAPVGAAMGVLYTLETRGVPLRSVPAPVICIGIGSGYVAAILAYRALSRSLRLWLTARTDGKVLELTHECEPGPQWVSRRFWLLLNRPLSFRKSSGDRGGLRAFRCGEVASIDTLRSYYRTEESVVIDYNLLIIEADGSEFNLGGWLLPTTTVPKQIILFAQHLRDVLDVPGEDRVSSS
jgi:hypothetical protein